MKTRQEMIYDFMVAFAESAEYTTDLFKDPTKNHVTPKVVADALYVAAAGAADKYLESLG